MTTDLNPPVAPQTVTRRANNRTASSKMEASVSLAGKRRAPEEDIFPSATFAFSRPCEDQAPIATQIIAHRGAKQDVPENTIAAFEYAVKVGANAIETDVRLSKDNVVVLCHDLSLMRCFGVDRNVSDCTWEQLSLLKTMRAPHLGMSRLVDLLNVLDTPEMRKIWLVLDIKRDDDPEMLIQQVSATIRQVKPRIRPWNERIVLGCWTPIQIGLAAKNLPGFPLSHISMSTLTASTLMGVPNLGFIINYASLSGSATFTYFPGQVMAFCRYLRTLFQSLKPGASKGAKRAERRAVPFIRLAHHLGRPTLAWTVNSGSRAEWCFSQGVDGIITDRPAQMVQLRNHWLAHQAESKHKRATIFSLPRSRFSPFALVRDVLQAILLHFVSIAYFSMITIRKNQWNVFWKIMQTLPESVSSVDGVWMKVNVERFSLFGFQSGLVVYLMWALGLTNSRSPDQIVVHRK